MPPDWVLGDQGTLADSYLLAALAALSRGSSVTDAASDAGVDRTTVHRWMRSNHEFRAGINRARLELATSVRRRVQIRAVPPAGSVAEGSA